MKNLFADNEDKIYWKFEVIYSFENETSLGALNFLINSPPLNGSCQINPLNGTIQTLFTILCSNWFDQHFIKDYSLFCRLIFFFKYLNIKKNIFF